MRVFVCAAIAAVALSSAAQPQTLPVRLSQNGHYIADVRVNGEGPFPFVVDTGASHSAIVLQLAEQFGYRDPQESPREGRSLTQPFEAELFLIEIEPENRPAQSVPAVVLGIDPDSGLAAYGLLGVDVLGRDTVHFDFAGGRVEFGTAGSPHRDGIVSEDLGLLFGEARIGSLPRQPVKVYIDSGSPYTIVNPFLAQRLRQHRSVQVSVDVAGISSRLEREEEGQWVRLRHVQVGGLCFDTHLALAADLYIFGALGWTNEPAMIVGLDFLERADLIVDYEAGEFSLDAHDPGDACRETARPLLR